MIKKLTLTIFLICAAMSAQASAQTVIDAEKQAAIKDYLAVMNESVKVGDIVNAVDGQMNQMAREMFASMIDKDNRMTAAERAEFEEMFFDPQTGILKRTQDNLLKNLDLEAMVNDLTYKIYDKHFTIAEIKEITAFYRTTTGQKMLKSMPEIMQESMAGMFEKLTPKMQELNEQLTKDIKREVETKMTELLARRKKTSNEIQ